MVAAQASDGSGWWGRHRALDLAFLESNFPCRAACPVGTNAGGYVALLAQGRYAEAYALARGPNPFASTCGRICAHPCEAACRRAAIDEPLNIRALKRVLTEKLGVESNVPYEQVLRAVERPREKAARPGRVAVIGAGPAGLACAHDLALMGHQVVVYEASKHAGGMMRLGIPEYRLPRELLDCEIDFIRFLGVEIRTGVEIGKDVLFEDLCKEHDAVFIGAGCRKGRQVNIPGAELAGVLTAVDFLAAANLGTELPLGERIVVVGGGNVAFDAARSAVRFGGTSEPDEEHHNLLVDTAMVAARLLRRQVTVVCLESREEMPADAREIEEADEEGIHLLVRRGPKAVRGNGRVQGLVTHDVLRVFDDNRRFAPEFIPDTDREIPCDTVIFAVGQVADLSFLGAAPGLEVSPRKTIVVDKHTLATTRRGVYAGGDVAFGPRIVIEAVADGRRAARAIDTQLTGRTDTPPSYLLRTFDRHGYDHPFARGDYETIPRRVLPTVPIKARSTRVEVERVLDDAQARAEGQRCLHCWVNTIFDSAEAEGASCIQCGGCVDVCPEQCLDLVSLARVGGTAPPPAGLSAQDGLSWVVDGQGAALIKDETRCIRCGLCARRCPADVIHMQALYRAHEAPLLAGADQEM